MNSQNIRVVAYSAVGVLVLVLVGIVSYIYLSGRQPAGLQQVARLNVGGVSSNEANSPFNVAVLNSGAYKALDKSLLDADKLPVKVPENRGKANLFGI
ncbi:MAG: hypothetical protein Q7S57_05505 [bacterium]|nr:hypothetical protein [bacterium]